MPVHRRHQLIRVSSKGSGAFSDPIDLGPYERVLIHNGQNFNLTLSYQTSGTYEPEKYPEHAADPEYSGPDAPDVWWTSLLATVLDPAGVTNDDKVVHIPLQNIVLNGAESYELPVPVCPKWLRVQFSAGSADVIIEGIRSIS